MEPSVRPQVQTCYRHPDSPAGVICQRCDRPICPRCMHQASVGFHCPECVKKGSQKVVTGPAAFRERPIITQVLIGLNVAVFAYMVIVDKADAITGETTQILFDYGLIAKLGSQGFFFPGVGVGEGEWYRMITSGFLHYGALHLLVNMYGLWILGQAVEHAGGRLRYGLIYGTSLLAGSLGALVVSPDALTAGASGAIFGLMGALFIAFRAMGVPLRNSPVLPVLLLNLVITFGVSNISIGGHIGGLIGGAASAWLLLDLPRRPGVDQRVPFVLCGLLAVACLVGGVVFANGYTPT